MKTINIFPERLSEPAGRSGKNGDRDGTLVEPEDVPVMSITPGDRPTKVPSGRKGFFKRFRRWTGKRLLCCVGPRRDGSSCRKDARTDEIVDNIGIEPTDENRVQTTNDGVERNAKAASDDDPSIVTNEPNAIADGNATKGIVAASSASNRACPTIEEHDETVVADREKRDGAAAAAACVRRVWVMDLLDYYTNEGRANDNGPRTDNGPRAQVGAITYALRWGETRRGDGTAATVPAVTVRRDGTAPESRTAAVDPDADGRDVTPAAVGREPCAFGPDGGATWDDGADCRRPIRSLADRLMSGKPCECDAPDGCAFYANVSAAIAAETRAAFRCRVTASAAAAAEAAAEAAAAVATTRDEPPKTAGDVRRAWNSFFRFENGRKTDGFVKKNRTNNVKRIRVVYKK